MKVDSPAIWGTQYCSANQSRRVEWLCLGTNRGCEGVDSHMQFLLVRAANSSVVGKPEVIWAFQHFVARSRNGLLGHHSEVRRSSAQRLVGRGGGWPRPPLRLERLREPGFQEFTQLGRGLELWNGIQFFEC